MNDQTLFEAHQQELYGKVQDALQLQTNMWGNVYRTPCNWNAITLEEYGKAVKAMNQGNLIKEADQIAQTIACFVHWYDEVRRQQRGVVSPVTPVDTPEQQTLEHLANHPPFQDFSIVVPDKPVRITYEHGTFDTITPDNMFVKGVD